MRETLRRDIVLNIHAGWLTNTETPNLRHFTTTPVMAYPIRANHGCDVNNGIRHFICMLRSGDGYTTSIWTRTHNCTENATQIVVSNNNLQPKS